MFLAKVIHGDGFSRLVAIKLLHPKWSENEEIASRMRDEARLLGWLRHKNIVDVMDLTMIDGRCAVIMEYLEAVDVKVVLADRKDNDLLMPLRVALEICGAVASALDAAYNRPPYAGEKPLRVIHRDIKPSNIMVDDTGTVKVLDFGVARAEFDQREAHTQELAFGSLEYMPPERLFFEPESAASDVYSLGATLYELLACEKFGKAKLRPEEHENHIRDRFEHLFDMHPMPSDEIEDEVWDLMGEMCAFDETDRPSAADACARMRSLARRLPQEGIDEWAEIVIPPLVQAVQAEEKSDIDPLVDKVLGEDTQGFARNVLPDDSEAEEMDSAVVRLAEITEEVEDSELDQTGHHDDARWSALKQATIEELTQSGQLGPVQRPLAPPPPPASEMVTVSSAPGTLTDLDNYRPLPTDEVPLPPPKKRRRKAPTRPPPPKRELPPPPAPVEESGSGLAMNVLLVGVLLVGLSLVVVGGVAIVGLGGWSVVAMSGGEEPSAPATAPKSAPKPAPAPAPEPPAAPAKAKPSGPGATFKSELPDTKKLSVRCDQGSGKGTTEVFIAGKKLSNCNVTAVTAKRKRAAALVKKVKPKTYTCFAGGDKSCK